MFVLYLPWILLAMFVVWLIFATVIVEAEGPLTMPLCVLILAVCIHSYLTNGRTLFDLTVEHKWSIAIATAIYIPIGCLYSAYRFYQLCRKRRIEFDEWYETKAEQEYERDARAPKGESSYFQTWVAERIEARFKPNVSDYRRSLIGWTAYWPPSAVWYVTHDFLRHVFDMVYQKMLAIYRGIADKAFE